MFSSISNTLEALDRFGTAQFPHDAAAGGGGAVRRRASPLDSIGSGKDEDHRVDLLTDDYVPRMPNADAAFCLTCIYLLAYFWCFFFFSIVSGASNPSDLLSYAGLRGLVLDLSACSCVDATAIRQLRTVVAQQQKRGLVIHCAAALIHVREALLATGICVALSPPALYTAATSLSFFFLCSAGVFEESQMHLTVAIAVQHAERDVAAVEAARVPDLSFSRVILASPEIGGEAGAEGGEPPALSEPLPRTAVMSDGVMSEPPSSAAVRERSASSASSASTSNPTPASNSHLATPRNTPAQPTAAALLLSSSPPSYGLSASPVNRFGSPFDRVDRKHSAATSNTTATSISASASASAAPAVGTPTSRLPLSRRFDGADDDEFQHAALALQNPASHN